MADFSRPSNDGALPDDFVEWQWGVTYTLRPPAGPPLMQGREYPITVSVRRMSAGPLQTYAPLEVVRREWFMVHETSLATVHVYFVV